MNVLTVTGNLGKDAELRDVSGTSVANFSLAIKSGYGDKAQTNWLDCSLWGKQAEAISQYMTKGKQITASGELGTREYEGKTYLTLRCDKITLGSRGDSEQQPAAAPTQQPAPNADSFDDDIPF